MKKFSLEGRSWEVWRDRGGKIRVVIPRVTEFAVFDTDGTLENCDQLGDYAENVALARRVAEAAGFKLAPPKR